MQSRSQTLVRQILAVLGATVLVAGLAYLIASLLPKVFASEQVLLFPAAQSATASLAQTLISSGGGTSSDPTAQSFGSDLSFPKVGGFPTSATAILESRRCREYVTERLGLAQKWHLTPSRTLDELKRHVNVRTDDNGLLVIGTQAESPELARDIAATMYQYLTSDSVELTLNISKRNRKALEARLKKSGESVEEARQQFVRIALQHPYFDQGPLQDLLVDALKKQQEAKTAIAAADAKISGFEARARQAMASGMDANALRALQGGAEDRTVEPLIEDLHKRRLELEDAKKTYTDKSPEFRAALDRAKAGESAVRKSVEESKRALDNKTFAPLVTARAELDALRKTQGEWDRALGSYKLMAAKTPGDATQVKIAQAEFDAALKAEGLLQVQLSQATLAEEGDPSRFEVIDEAVADPDPVSPRKGLIAGAAAFAAFACGLWWVARRRMVFLD
ncbi:MAG: hypothetical protein JSS66_12245 [Armatimonadetes bacterium]|nr:hypothetical protein [Armatimonadota bacterium]